MPSINVHIYPSSFKNESRIEKQAVSISNMGIFDSVLLIGAGKGAWDLREGVSVRLLGSDNVLGTLSEKIKRFIGWYKSVYSYLKDKEVDCVNAHSLSVLPLAVALKFIKGAKLIYDPHELETETNGNFGARRMLARLTERILIRFSDHVFVVSHSISEFYSNTYGLKSVDVVLNAPNEVPLLNNDIFRDKFAIPKDTIIFLYQGVLSEGRGVELLLQTFSSLEGSPVCIVFMGYGPLVNEIKVRQKESKAIYYHPAVSPKMVHSHTSSADIGLALIQDTCLSYSYCLPNKLFEYGMAGLPCIVSPLVEMSRYVNENKCGFILEKVDQIALTKIIEKVCNIDLSVFKKNARAAALSHSWHKQELVLIQVYKKIFGGS